MSMHIRDVLCLARFSFCTCTLYNNTYVNLKKAFPGKGRGIILDSHMALFIFFLPACDYVVTNKVHIIVTLHMYIQTITHLKITGTFVELHIIS